MASRMQAPDVPEVLVSVEEAGEETHRVICPPMSKIPSLVLSLKLETPLARALELLDRHFSFLIPVGVELPGGRTLGVLPPQSTFLPNEIVIAGGRLSTLRDPVRLESWAGEVKVPWYGLEVVCLHRLRLAPDGTVAPIFRYQDDGGRWSTLTNLTIMRNGPGLSLHVIMLHSGWYPLWDCPPLRTFDMDHWMEMLSGLRNAVTDAGDAVNHVSVGLGHYAFHEPWKTRLMAEARTIPMAEVE